MEQLKKKIDQLKSEIDQAYDRIGLEKLVSELNDLRAQMQQPDFWQDNLKAQDVSKQEAELARRIDPWKNLRSQVNELADLAELGGTSIESELEEQLSALNAQFSSLKKELRFQGPYDGHNVILSIYAGAGGTDVAAYIYALGRSA
jgi:peptide chain release factor 2